MRTLIPFAVFLALGGQPALAQEPVLIAGGATATTPVQVASQPVQVAPVVYAMPVAYIAQPGYADAVQVASGGCYPSANVLYVGGPNSCYRNAHQNQAFQRGCNYSPNIIYFGRGEALERGYAFRRHR